MSISQINPGKLDLDVCLGGQCQVQRWFEAHGGLYDESLLWLRWLLWDVGRLHAYLTTCQAHI